MASLGYFRLTKCQKPFPRYLQLRLFHQRQVSRVWLSNYITQNTRYLLLAQKSSIDDCKLPVWQSPLRTIGQPAGCQAIFWINADLILVGTLGMDFSAIWSKTQWNSYKKMKMSSGKWLPSCLGLNVLTCALWIVHNEIYYDIYLVYL